MKREWIVRIFTALLAALVLVACGDQEPDPTAEPPPTEAPEEPDTTGDANADGGDMDGAMGESADFEIWAVDQSDTRADQGGVLYIWDGNAQAGDEAEVVDLAQAADEAGCPAGKRPHMVLTNHASPPTHVIMANVGSGSTFFVDPATRQLVGCVSTKDGFNGIGGSAQSHAANGTPDDSMVIIADIGGKDADGNNQSGWLHKIQTDYSTSTFKLVETLPLHQFADDLGTSLARPICHEFTPDSRFAYVTFGGGGILVVDVGSADGSTPMTMAHAYPADVVPGVGCGTFVPPETPEIMLTNGASTSDPNPTDGDWMYVFDTSGHVNGEFPTPTQIALPGADTHGVQVCVDPDGNQFAWSLMRVTSEISIVDLQSNEVVATHSLKTDFAPDPTPDLGFMRDGKFYFTLRGPEPLTAITSLTSDQRTPGVAVITMSEDCKSFTWDETDLLTVGDNTVLPPDPHGMELVTIATP